jgi:hypothetical protein
MDGMATGPVQAPDRVVHGEDIAEGTKVSGFIQFKLSIGRLSLMMRWYSAWARTV